MESSMLRNLKQRPLVLALIGICLVPGIGAWTSAQETTLRGDLETGYEDDVRPIEVTVIGLGFQMTSLDSVDIKSQTFGVSGWWVFEWEDTRLSWNPAAYGNIPMLQYYQNDLWTPAFVISNSVTDLAAIEESTIPVRVTYEGKVSWHPPGIFKTGCEMDTTHFPFDVQTCGMQVTSFGYTVDEVQINITKGILMDFYSPSGDWEILEMYADEDTYDDAGDIYSRIFMSCKLKRLNTYHWFNIILPVVVSGILIIFVFLLPVPSGEKMGYSLTCLLTYVVLLTLIAAEMPTTAKHVSILEVYLTIVLIISGFTVFCSIAVINLYETPDDHRIPWLIVRGTQRCWPFVDWRKETAKESNKADGKIHPEGNDIKYKKDAAREFSAKEKGLRTPVTKMASVDEDPYRMELINGQVCALVVDRVLFRIFVVVIPVFTMILLIVLAVGGDA